MKTILLALMLLMMCFPANAQEPLPEYSWPLMGELVAEHASDTLHWRIERITIGRAECYLTKVWMASPGTQVGKAASDWEENIMNAADLAQQEENASLIINASGYVTRTYSWIPENYPGESADYFFTPLGSVTVTDGVVYRCLEGVPYYGLTLQADGLHLHVGDDPQAVLASGPSQTWSFYVECPVIRDHTSILDPEWRFTNTRAVRTIIAKMDDNNYALLTVTSRGGGLTMAECVDFLLRELDPEWAYNLDGGPSSALMYRDEDSQLHTVWKNGQKNVDVMTFSD